jgi:hypothetical protein
MVALEGTLYTKQAAHKKEPVVLKDPCTAGQSWTNLPLCVCFVLRLVLQRAADIH